MFTQKKIKIAFNIMLILIGIFAISQVGLATPFVLGGVILQGILGGFSGKVGPVVGGKWKDIDYMRGYVVPSNPNTTGQQTVRAKFSALVAQARQVISTLINPFWDPFYTTMSGFNKFISLNYGTLSVANKLSLTSIMSKGTLEPAPISTCTYATATGEIQVTYPITPSGNGLATDECEILAYDEVGDKLFYSHSGATRGDGANSITIDAGLSPAAVFVWIFFYQGSGQSLLVSDSDSSVTVAP